MDNELTTTEKKAFDLRTTLFAANNGSFNHPLLPRRAHVAKTQGARFGITPIESGWPTAVAALQTGGAPQSKWTRKTRPWNVSLPATVVASAPRWVEDLATEFQPVIDRTKREPIPCWSRLEAPKLNGLSFTEGGSQHSTCSSESKPRTAVRELKGDLSSKVAREGRIHGSSVRVRVGGG